jgi:coenzyme F420-0:L-glutamate ligase/coenzyme F420-1:gamma-L-glutamate ligase
MLKGGLMPLVITPLTGIPLVNPGDNLFSIMNDALKRCEIQMENGDILVITQKIISKAQGRYVDLSTIQPSKRAQEIAQRTNKDPRFVEVVLSESCEVLRTEPGRFIVVHKYGFVCANAGIDHSNVHPKGVTNPDDWVLLLPEEPDNTADAIREEFQDAYQKKCGVLIIDSHGRAWRKGTVGVTIGVAGIPALEDLRGKPDLFGYKLQVSEVAAADELAAAASLVMGQATESIPVVHVRGFPYPLRESSMKELIRPKEEDLFR